MARGALHRRVGQVLLLPALLLVMARAGAVGMAAAAEVGAPPRVVANAPSFQIMDFAECTPLRPVIEGSGLSYQWEESVAGSLPLVWKPLAGQTGPSLCIAFRCNPLGMNPVYRLVATNAAGSVSTRPTVVSVQLPFVRLLRRPQPVVTRVAGDAPSVELVWEVAPDASMGTAVLTVTVAPSRTAPLGGTYDRVAVAMPLREPLRLGVPIPQVEAWDGTTFTAALTYQCNSVVPGRPSPGYQQLLEPVTLRVLPTGTVRSAKVAACPADQAVNADYDGWVLRSGVDSPSLPTCSDCRSLCAATVGCDTWVYGAATGGARSGQCWLKAARRDQPYRPVLKVSATPNWPWMSGVMPAYESCPGTWGDDLEGEVLVRGDTHRRPDCAACAAACDALPGCSIWVWGYLPSSNRYRECWLKKRINESEEPARKPGSGVGSPWLSGTVRPYGAGWR